MRSRVIEKRSDAKDNEKMTKTTNGTVLIEIPQNSFFEAPVSTQRIIKKENTHLFATKGSQLEPLNESNFIDEG